MYILTTARLDDTPKARPSRPGRMGARFIDDDWNTDDDRMRRRGTGITGPPNERRFRVIRQNHDMSRKGRGATNRIKPDISMTEDDETMKGKEQGWRRITNGDSTSDIDDSTDSTYRARRFVQTYRSYIAIRSTTHDRLSYPDTATRNGITDDTGARTDVDMDWKGDWDGETNAVR